MIFIYYPLAALLVYFSYRSFRGGIDYLSYFRQELAKPRSAFTPFATVIVPCKGLDEGLSANLSALLMQDYPAYEVIFVVDSPDDASVPVINDVSSNSPVPTRLIVAGKAADSGQKVENLREAVLHADSGSEILVFADSDVHPANDWLAGLAAPLEDQNIGAASGYRWFVSENSSVASELCSAWNASIASVQGPDMGSNFCWGGSMAFRRETFERLAIRENWKGTLSDDLAATRLIKAAGMPIYFVPKAVVPSAANFSPGGLFEFTNRQIKITRVYTPKLWLMSFMGSGLFNLIMAASVLILFTYPISTFAAISALFTLFSVTLLSVGKSWLRCNAVSLSLAEHRSLLDRQLKYQLTLWLLAPAVFFINCAVALFSRKIRWRGTEYEMISAAETRVLTRDPDGKN